MAIDPIQLYRESRALRSGDRELLRGAATARVDLLAQLSAPSLRGDMEGLLRRRFALVDALYEAALLLDLTGLELWDCEHPDGPQSGGYVSAMEDWDDWEEENGGHARPCRIVAL